MNRFVFLSLFVIGFSSASVYAQNPNIEDQLLANQLKIIEEQKKLPQFETTYTHPSVNVDGQVLKFSQIKVIKTTKAKREVLCEIKNVELTIGAVGDDEKVRRVCGKYIARLYLTVSGGKVILVRELGEFGADENVSETKTDILWKYSSNDRSETDLSAVEKHQLGLFDK